MKSLVYPVYAVLLLVAYALGSPVDLQVKKAMDRCVYVETETAVGTGIIVYSNTVLTNYHVVDDNTPVTVNGKEAKVIKRDKKHDMALLMTDTPAFEWVEFCEPEVTEQVFYVGHPMMHKTKFVVPGSIIALEDFDDMGNNIKGAVYATSTGLPGFSGSGLYCKEHGKLVGINFASHGKPPQGYPFNIAIPTQEIKKFLDMK